MPTLLSRTHPSIIVHNKALVTLQANPNLFQNNVHVSIKKKSENMGRKKGRSDSSHHEQDYINGCLRKQTQERQFWRSWSNTPIPKNKAGTKPGKRAVPAGGPTAAPAQRHKKRRVSEVRLQKPSTNRKRRRPTLPRVCSTIGATGLNCSVRNGKRWDPGAIAA